MRISSRSMTEHFEHRKPLSAQLLAYVIFLADMDFVFKLRCKMFLKYNFLTYYKMCDESSVFMTQFISKKYHPTVLQQQLQQKRWRNKSLTQHNQQCSKCGCPSREVQLHHELIAERDRQAATHGGKAAQAPYRYRWEVIWSNTWRRLMFINIIFSVYRPSSALPNMVIFFSTNERNIICQCVQNISSV